MAPRISFVAMSVSFTVSVGKRDAMAAIRSRAIVGILQPGLALPVIAGRQSGCMLLPYECGEQVIRRLRPVFGQQTCGAKLFPDSIPGLATFHRILMRTNFVLVDFENVQPKDLGLLKDDLFKVKLFLGPNQSKIPVALASSLQSLGNNAEYIVLETAGNNALDFHIAYYIGLLSAEDPSAFFHIISKDSGFDPLIKHLKGRKVFAQRSTCIANIPYFKPTLPTTPEAQIEVVVADLIRRKTSKPRTQKTLLSTLHALFKKELSEQQLSQLFASLCSRGVVKVDGTKVSYELPVEP